MARSRIEIQGDSSGAVKAMDQAGGAAVKMAKDIGDLGAKIAGVGIVVTNALTVPILALGAASMTAARQFEKSHDIIRVQTGKTGKSLDALDKSVKRIYAQVPGSLDDVTAAVTEISQRTSNTGKNLEKLAITELHLADMFGEDVSEQIALTTRMFGDWTIATKDQIEALDWLLKLAQHTGIGINELARVVTWFGAPLRQMGFSFEESTAMLGKWEKEGVNITTVLAGLKMGLKKFAAAGLEPEKALDAVIKKIKEADTLVEANSISFAVFGQRAGPDLAAAIREGRFEYDDMLESMRNSTETVEKAFEESLSFVEELKIMFHELLVVVEPLGTTLIEMFRKLKPVLQKVVDWLLEVSNSFNKLDESTKYVIIALGATLALIGPAITLVGALAMALPALISPWSLIAGGIVAATGVLAGFIAKSSEAKEFIWDFGESIVETFGFVADVVSLISEQAGITTTLKEQQTALEKHYKDAAKKRQQDALNALKKTPERQQYQGYKFPDDSPRKLSKKRIDELTRPGTIGAKMKEQDHILGKDQPGMSAAGQAYSKLLETLSILKAKYQEIKTIAFEFWTAAEPYVMRYVETVKQAGQDILEAWAPVGEELGELFSDLWGIIKGLIEFVDSNSNVFGPMFEAGIAILSTFKDVVVGVFKLLGLTIATIIAILHGDFTDAWKYAGKAGELVMDLLKGAVQNAWKAIGLIWAAGIELIKNLFARIAPSFANVVTKIVGYFDSAWKSIVNFINKIVLAINKVLKFFNLSQIGLINAGQAGKSNSFMPGVGYGAQEKRAGDSSLGAGMSGPGSNLKGNEDFSLFFDPVGKISNALNALGNVPPPFTAITPAFFKMIKDAVAKKFSFSAMIGKLGGVLGGPGYSWANALAQKFGLSISSTFRPGAITASGYQSYHSMYGKAADLYGAPSRMGALAQYLFANGKSFAEIIYQHMGMKYGVPYYYGRSDHFNHVHVARGDGAGKATETPAQPTEVHQHHHYHLPYGSAFIGTVEQFADLATPAILQRADALAGEAERGR